MIQVKVLPWANGQRGYTAFVGPRRVDSAKLMAGQWMIWLKGQDTVVTTNYEENAKTELKRMVEAHLTT